MKQGFRSHRIPRIMSTQTTTTLNRRLTTANEKQPTLQSPHIQTSEVN